MNAIGMSRGTSRVLSAVFASVGLAVVASASTTYIVDANGGFDFTDIPPAIAAASPGDVIIVHPGGYSGFTLDKGLSIAGTAGVTTSSIQINNIASNPRVALTSFHCLSLSVTSCSVPVIVNDLTADVLGSIPSGYVIDVQASTDVRFRGLQVPDMHGYGVSAVRAWQSRVEITSSTLNASSGFPSPNGGFADAGPGGIGVLCDGSSDVHISLSSITGGGGGFNDYQQDFNGNAGNGGVGIQVQGTSKLLLTGTASNLVVGGYAGEGVDCTHDGYPGSGLSVVSGSYARSSTVAIQAGGVQCGLHNAPAVSGSVDFVSPIDPSLELSGTELPGQVLTLVIHGTPGDSARIRLGRQAVVHDTGSYEDELTNPLRIYDLGALPASGMATKHVTIPGSLPHGYLMVFQGSTVGSDGITRLTQSAPVVVQ